MNGYHGTVLYKSWAAEVVSDKDEKVISSKYLENVYDELIKLDKWRLTKN